MEVLAGLAMTTAGKVDTVFNAVERVLNLKFLRNLDSSALSRLVKALRDADKTESTIRGYLAHLRSALNWAKTVG